MKKKLSASILIIALAGLAIMLVGCDDRKEVDDPPDTAGISAEPGVSYGTGFSALEVDGARSWRWMGNEGIVKLKNSNREMSLSLVADIPMNAFPHPPTIKIVFNGKPLDQFQATQKIIKEYAIPSDKQGGKLYSELRIVTDKTFVPKELDKNSNDDRKLSLSLTRLEWAAR